MFVKKILKIMRTGTFRQSVITVISSFGAAGLGAVFYLFLARNIGSQDYGLFSISVSILTILVGISDLGMAQSMIRFISENHKHLKFLPYAKIALVSRLIIGFILWAVLWIFAEPISNLLNNPSLIQLLPLIGFGLLTMSLFSFSLYIFQGLQKFLQWGILQVGGNIFRLILFAMLLLFIKINSFWGIVLFISAPLFGFIISWLWLPLKMVFAKIEKRHNEKFWKFNRWTSLFTIVNVIASRVDILVSSRFVNLSDIGIYSLASTMVAFLPQLSSALSTVTSPKFASFSKTNHSRKYVFKSTLFTLGISVFVGALMIPVALFVVWFTGRDFIGAMTPFSILLIALLLFSLLNPVRDSLLYYYKQPKFFFWANLIQFVTLIVSLIIFVPIWGITGTAMAVLVGHITLACICLWKYQSLSRPFNLQNNL